MPLTLFGSPGSGSAAVEMALRAATVEYRVLRASAWEPDSAITALREVNPLGQVPTLVLADKTVLTESAAILIYLGLEFPGHALLPETSTDRAVALRGLIFIAANCYPAVSVSDYPERWTTATTKSAQERVRAAARAQLHRNWGIFFDAFASELERTKEHPGALAFLSVVVSRWSGTRQYIGSTRKTVSTLLATLEAHPRIACVLSEQSAA
ncbi:glutathione S-transferase [Rubrivivax sp. RP6-9]|uniref:glutathione S-transferase n=1 Tax=Rubrivivax sp. RP6-9 TaxID=3415750 RepID=UPI003CC5D0C8